MRFLLFADEVMPDYQRIEKNKNIAKRNISNFVEFSCGHHICKTCGYKVLLCGG